jgi:hypothetical protein
MGVKGKPDIHRHHREQKTTMVWPRQKYARGENTKINYGMDATGEKKRTSKKNVVGRSTSSHDKKKFRTRSIKETGRNGICFPEDGDSCYKTGWMDEWMDGWVGGCVDRQID